MPIKMATTIRANTRVSFGKSLITEMAETGSTFLQMSPGCAEIEVPLSHFRLLFDLSPPENVEYREFNSPIFYIKDLRISKLAGF